MSFSFKNHRIVIASLFLPSTVVLGDSSPPSPPGYRGPSLPSASPTLAKKPQLKSIVDDLKDKTSRIATPCTLSPEIEKANPFSFPPDSAKKYETTHSVDNPSRLQRKATRSSSRKPDTEAQNLFVTKSWRIEPNPRANIGLKNAVDSVKNKLSQKIWVGTLGSDTDSFSAELRADVDAAMLERESLPIWIPDAEFESCYDEFCHQVLWPCLHYAIPDAPKTKIFYESAAFKQYVSVNQRFADAIAQNYREGDVIWVNDYHLMLLPGLLRAHPLIPSHAPIGFFMHVAFPSSEIFRCLSIRERLLRGILAADLVGFQTPNYARHFRQTVSRVLACEALPRGILIDAGPVSAKGKNTPGADGKNADPEDAASGSRFVDVAAFPIGIDVTALRVKRSAPDVAEWVQTLKQRYVDMHIIVGRDKLDEVQGVRHKLRAFATFLERHPEFQKRVVLIQVALQTTESNELAAGGVADLVSQINSRFSTLTYQPVVFLHTQDLTFSQYLALLTVADAFLVTSLREGMALRTHEFVECQEGRYRPLVLSEFTGSYSINGFRSCIAINPWDTIGTAEAIYKALTMDDAEAKRNWDELHKQVMIQTAQAFATNFLTKCIRANVAHQPAEPVEPLDVALLAPRYRYSNRRLILLDYEGTLWIRGRSKEDIFSSSSGETVAGGIEDVSDLLSALAGDAKNDVWVLSGLTTKQLQSLADRIPRIGIIAENGCYIKPRGSVRWVDMVAGYNLTWKTPCVEMLHYFTERTPGSFVEERFASVVWRFWTGAEDADCADRQWARRQAAEAQNHIFDSLGERYGLRIVPGTHSFLVIPSNASRAAAANAILHPSGPAGRSSSLSESASTSAVQPSEETFSVSSTPMTGSEGSNEADFVLVVSKDEKLLCQVGELDNSETVSTGGRGTEARWKLDVSEVRAALWQLIRG